MSVLRTDNWTGTIDTRGSVRNQKITSVSTLTEMPELNLPTARNGAVIPYVLGRQRIFSPNVIWFGAVNLDILEEKQIIQEDTRYESTLPPDGGLNIFEPDPGVIINTETTKITRKVVGYTLDVQIGLCLGPGVKLLGIYRGDTQIWQGSVGSDRYEIGYCEGSSAGLVWNNGQPVPAEITSPGWYHSTNNAAFTATTFTVEDDALKNGFIFQGGDFDQSVDPYLFAKMDAAEIPAYVGTSYIILKNVNSKDLNGASLSFEVSRMPDALSLGVDNIISGNDINVASAMADIIINDWGALGLDISDIDTDSFNAAATLYATEGNGCSIVTDRENFGSQILRELQTQVRSYLIVDPETNKIKLVPVRVNAYDEETVISFDEDDIINFQEIDKQAWSDIFSVINLTYLDRQQSYKETTVSVINPSTVPTLGRGRRLSAVNAHAVCTKEIASAVVSSFLEHEGQPSPAFRLQFNRRAAGLTPGNLILISYSKYGFVKVPMVVSKYRETDARTNQIVLDCVLYNKINIGNISTSSPVTDFVDVDVSPQVPVDDMLVTSPYWLASRMIQPNPSYIDYQTGSPILLVKPGNDKQMSFDVYDNDLEQLRAFNIPYPGYAKLAASIDITDGWINGELVDITLKDVIGKHLLVNVDFSDLRNGERLLFIGDEIFAYETVVNNYDGTFTLTDVYRAFVDTVAQNHSIDDDVYIIDRNQKRFLNTNTTVDGIVDLSFVSRGFTEKGKYPDDGYDTTFTANNRYNAVVRPHKIRIGGARTVAAIDVSKSSTHLLEWSTRSRNWPILALPSELPNPREVISDTKYQAHLIYLTDSASTVFYIGCSGDPADAGFIDDDSYTLNVPPSAALGAGFIEVISCVFDTENTDEVDMTRQSLYNEKIPINVIT